MANDFALAEQFGRAARSAGAGFDAAFVVAECLMLTGRHDEAETAMAMLDDEVETDAELVQLAERPSEQPDAGSRRRGRRDRDPPGGPRRGRRRAGRRHDPGPARRRPRARRRDLVRRSPPPSRCFTDRAAISTSGRPTPRRLAQAMLGRVDEAVDIGVMGYIHHHRSAQATRQLPESQHIGPVLALVAGGRLDEAERTRRPRDMSDRSRRLTPRARPRSRCCWVSSRRNVVPW